MFYVGQKVICVDASISDKYLPAVPSYNSWVNDLDGLTEGVVYTIAGTADFFGAPVVFVAEIKRPPHSDGSESGYAAARFRPVVQKKTDISVFTKMLKDTKAKEPA